MYIYHLHFKTPHIKTKLAWLILILFARLRANLAEREAAVAALTRQISEKEARLAVLEARLLDLQLSAADSDQVKQEQVQGMIQMISKLVFMRMYVIEK